MRALFLAMMLVPVMAFGSAREIACPLNSNIDVVLDSRSAVTVWSDARQLIAWFGDSKDVLIRRFQPGEFGSGCFLLKDGPWWRLSYTGAAGAPSGCYYLTLSLKNDFRRDNAVTDPVPPSMPVTPVMPSRSVSPEIRETLVDIPSDKVSTVPCGSSMVHLSLAVDQVNVYGWVNNRRFKMPKVTGYDSDRTNRTLVYSGFDGWRIYYLDGAGAGPGKVRIAVLKE